MGAKDKELSPFLIDSGLIPEELVAPSTLPSAVEVTIGVSRAPSPQAKVLTTEAQSTSSLAQTEIYVIVILEVVEIPPSLGDKRKEDEDNALVELSVNEGSAQEDQDTDKEKVYVLHVRFDDFDINFKYRTFVTMMVEGAALAEEVLDFYLTYTQVKTPRKIKIVVQGDTEEASALQAWLVAKKDKFGAQFLLWGRGGVWPD
ncbi:hypothetical protein ACFE04_004340 [Oxalis oulophora]